MADTYTAYLNLTKPEVNSSRDTWGEKGNQNWDALDNFARRVEKVAGGALSREITTAQSVAGPVEFNGYASFKNGAGSENGFFTKGTLAAQGSVQSQNGNLQAFGLNGNLGAGLVSLNQAASRFVLWDGEKYQMPGGDLFINGRRALLTGDVDLSPYLNKNDANGQTVTGNVLIARAGPEYQMVWGGVLRAGMGITGDGKWRLRNIDTDDTWFQVSSDGAIYTKQFGDLNNRIEQRASDYANAAAGNVGNQRVVAVALQGAWTKSTNAGQTSADHPGVMTGVGIGTNGIVVNITGRYVYFNTPSRGWVGADSI